MKEGLLGDTLHSDELEQVRLMLQAGLGLSRNRLDVCLLSEHGELVEEFAVLDVFTARSGSGESGWRG